MISLADVTTQMNFCKTLAIALPNFYRKTNLTASFVFQFKPETTELEINLGFLPKEPTEEQYSILFEEILDAEKLLINEYILNSSNDFENLKQFVFKHKESTLQIVNKNK